jgi:hypothetical protein
MTITINIPRLASIRAASWRNGSTNGVKVSFRQDDGVPLVLCFYVKDSYARAAAICQALNGAGNAASPYDPELDGVTDLPLASGFLHGPAFREAV